MKDRDAGAISRMGSKKWRPCGVAKARIFGERRVRDRRRRGGEGLECGLTLVAGGLIGVTNLGAGALLEQKPRDGVCGWRRAEVIEAFGAFVELSG